MLPYTRVQFLFSAARAQAPNITYYGCVKGKATRLHDLYSKGYFTPLAADCGSGSDYDLTQADSEFDIPKTDYPALVSGNSVDADTVKVYLKNLKYFGIRKTVNNSAFIAGDYVGIPLDANSVKLGTIKTVDAEITDAFEVALDTAYADSFLFNKVAASDIVDYTNVEEFVPGTLGIKVVVPTSLGDVTLLITDVPNSVNSETTVETLAVPATVASQTPITGQLFVYGPSTVSLNSNSLKYSWNSTQEKFIFTGYISIKEANFSGTLPTVTTKITKAECLDSDVSCNIKEGDTLFLGKRGYMGGYDGVQNVLNPDGTVHLQYDSSDSEMLMQALIDEVLSGDIPSNAEFTGGDATTNSQHGAFSIANSVDYGKSTFSGSADIYNGTGDFDYRVHMGIAHMAYETDRERRLEADGQYEIITSGAASLIGQITIDPSTMLIDTRVRDCNDESDDTYSAYAATYDADPSSYPAIAPTMSDVNFISGSLRIEYEEKVESGALTDTLFKMSEVTVTNNTLSDVALPIDIIGQYDPRNELGFSVGMVTKLSTTDFYFLPVLVDNDALEVLSEHRFIYHIWNVDTVISNTFTQWVANENLPKQSRFRLGYQFKSVPTEITRVAAASAYTGSLTVSPTSYKRTFTTISPINFINLGVAAGDVFTDDAGDDYTVEFVSNSAISFTERFSRAIDFNNNPMTYSTGSWSYVFSGPPAESGVMLKLRVKEIATGIISKFEGTVAELNAEAYATCTYVAGTLTLTFAGTHSAVGIPKASAIPVATTIAGYSIVRTLTPTEQVNLLVANQTDNEPAMNKILTKDIKYKMPSDADGTFSAYLPDYAAPALVFGAKITLLPHFPLTEMTFNTSGSELGEVTGLRKFKRTTHLEPLGDAGYNIINSEIGGAPFCESDFTTGYALYGDSDRGLLSKIDPVYLYGKDTYEITKKFKGGMNTDVPATLTLINTNLQALKDKYTSTPYGLLGTLLKSVSDQVVTFDGSTTIVTHRISSQDPARYVENKIYVD